MNATKLCSTCRSTKVERDCELCSDPICRSCQQFLDQATFSFMPQEELDPKLRHTFYCQACFAQEVEPARETYEETLEKARKVYVFEKPIQVLQRAHHKVAVKDCTDRKETVLRLAFLAAKQGFNSLTQIEVIGEKVRNHGYETHRWKGEALPANVDDSRFDKRTPKNT